MSKLTDLPFKLFKFNIYHHFDSASMIYVYFLAALSSYCLVKAAIGLPATSIISQRDSPITTPFGTSNLSLTVECACQQLFSLYSAVVFFPNSTNYTMENLAAWDERSNLDPGCIFIPVNANQVAKGMSVLNICNAQFAIRGGGHMNVRYNGGLWANYI